MTMTPDELRALADALEPMSSAPRFEGMNVLAFCAWVRACADAEPVARIYTDAEMVHRDERWGRVQWIEPESELAEGTLLYTHPAPAAPHYAMLDSHRRLVEQAIQSAEHPSGMSTHDGKAHIDASVLRRMLAIIDSLPAAPQAEPIDPHMIVAEDRFPDEQAEPKREPLREEGVVATLVREGVNKHKAREIVAWIKQHGIGGSDER